MQDRADSHAHERAFDIARQPQPHRLSGKTWVAEFEPAAAGGPIMTEADEPFVSGPDHPSTRPIPAKPAGQS